MRKRRKNPTPTHHLLVEQADWSGILQARKEGVPWDELRTRTGLSALGMTIYNGSALAAQTLLEIGAPTSPEYLFDGSFFSPIWATLEKHRPEILDLLLQAGANPNEEHPEHGLPIAFAAQHSLLDETLVLSRHGSIPNTENAPSPLWLWIKNTIPLYDAVQGEWTFPENTPIIALLKNGARIHVEDEDGIGLSELDLAKKLWLNQPLSGRHKQNMQMTLSLIEKNLYTNMTADHNLYEDSERVQKKPKRESKL